MKLSLLSIIAFLTVVLVATHAALPPEIYWKSLLRNTPMPELLKDLLHSTGGGTTMHGVGGMDAMTNYNQNNYGYSELSSRSSKSQLLQHYNSNETLFFLEKDLKAGNKMNFLFQQTSNHASFLPREVVKSIPFSSSKMDEILNKYEVKRGSVGAEQMKNTINICKESAGIKGEERYCATSLESMVDFVILQLGKSVNALSMNVRKQTKEEEYTTMNGVKKVGETEVVCHNLNYVYAVFICHKIDNTVAYTVPLEGADGSRIKALCVCHRDTSNWNPKHLSFQMLKVNPGTVPICHFLYQDAVLWVPKQN